MEILELKNLTLSYGKNVVIKDLSLSIFDGDFVCIVGPNGSGKTTLVNGILGLLKPTSGKVVLKGFLQNQIGYIPQENDIDSNFPALVSEVVSIGNLNGGSKDVDAVLETVGILKLKNKSFAELSGGERQKVLIARALLAAKKILILDEPSNNLDQKSKCWLYGFLQELNKKEGLAIIMVTHDLDHGNLIGNKILSLRDKEIFFGKTEDFVKKVHNE